MKKYITLSLILVSLLSCIKTIDFNDEQYANQLILNSIIWPDSAFQASLSKSTSILENDYGPVRQIPGAMDIYENDQLLAHLSSTTGKFRAADIKPKAGNTYRVIASSQGKQIEAQTTIPLKAEVVSVDTSLVKTGGPQKTMYFNLKLKDTPGEDYYRIIVEYDYLSLYRYNGTRTYYLNKNIGWGKISDDPVFKSVYSNSGEEIFDMVPENRYNIFPDDIFNGKERSIQVKTTFYSYPYDPSNPQMHSNQQTIYDRFTLHVQRISKDLYNYMKYLELYDYYHDNPISEPVPVYSNVKNGAGIFAGFNNDASYTYEKVYLPYSMDTIKIEGNHSNGGGYGGGYGY